jgi:hypothetical protein
MSRKGEQDLSPACAEPWDKPIPKNSLAWSFIPSWFILSFLCLFSIEWQYYQSRVKSKMSQLRHAIYGQILEFRTRTNNLTATFGEPKQANVKLEQLYVMMVIISIRIIILLLNFLFLRCFFERLTKNRKRMSKLHPQLLNSNYHVLTGMYVYLVCYRDLTLLSSEGQFETFAWQWFY